MIEQLATTPIITPSMISPIFDTMAMMLGYGAAVFVLYKGFVALRNMGMDDVDYPDNINRIDLDE